MVALPFPFRLERRRQAEIMDQPGLEQSRHEHALTGLERINRVSGSVRILWPAVRDLLWQHPGRTVRLLDIATGAGDVPIGLWLKAAQAGFPLHVDGCDVSPAAVEHARRRALERQAEIQFHQVDVLQKSIDETYDVVTCSLFLHHLEETPAVELLRRMAGAARQLVLVNDLVRSPGGLVLAHVATRLLTTSNVVHIDGPRSVRAAFTVPEALALAHRAGLHGATVARRWPFRFLLTWKRS